MEIAAEYIDHMGSDRMVVNAARVSFAKHVPEGEWRDSDVRLLHYLARHGHWTPFAHPQVCFRITAPIFVARQLMRHTVGLVVNEVSRRYVDDEPQMWQPTTWRERPGKDKKQGSGENPLPPEAQAAVWYAWDDAISRCLTAYQDLINAGTAPEQARAVLPQAMFTQWYWTGSLAAWARICKQRLDPHAQEETRILAVFISSVP